MSKKTETKTTTTSKSLSFRGVINFISYIAVFCIGIALILNVIFKGNAVSHAFQMIAECLAYTVVSISAFYYAKSRRNMVYLICWLVAVILIVVFIILR